MKNAIKKRCEAPALAHVIAIVLLVHYVLPAQPIVTAIPSGCKLNITTDLGSEPIDPMKGETSVGFFYRLDGLNNEGSYFWDATISGTNTSISKSIDLPTGSYSLVAYQTRKGGPIKTGSRVTINNTNACSPGIMPLVNDPLLQQVKLSASWNVFTDPFYSNPTCSHETMSTRISPAAPWLFVTLSVFRWPALGNDISIHFDDTNLDYIGAIADNYDDSQQSSWKYVDDVDYTLNSGVVTVKRKNGVPLPPNSERHIHLIFDKGSSDLGSLINTVFTANFINANGTTGSTSIAPPVKGTPHDPNSLDVDKDWLCPCQANEVLIYQVNFQNLGSAAADKVTVQLSNEANLDFSPSSVQVMLNTNSDQKTFLKYANIAYDQASRTFTITPINLPGTNQLQPRTYDEWETQDYFKFKIRKKDCVRNGTIIQPNAAIKFFAGMSSMGIINTNLEETHVIDKPAEGIKCPDPHPSCNRCTKRRCWLANLFKKKQK